MTDNKWIELTKSDVPKDILLGREKYDFEVSEKSCGRWGRWKDSALLEIDLLARVGADSLRIRCREKVISPGYPDVDKIMRELGDAIYEALSLEYKALCNALKLVLEGKNDK